MFKRSCRCSAKGKYVIVLLVWTTGVTVQEYSNGRLNVSGMRSRRGRRCRCTRLGWAGGDHTTKKTWEGGNKKKGKKGWGDVHVAAAEV